MKKKLILGAIALMSVFGGITIYESMSGQNEVKANVPPKVLPATAIYCGVDCTEPDNARCYFH